MDLDHSRSGKHVVYKCLQCAYRVWQMLKIPFGRPQIFLLFDHAHFWTASSRVRRVRTASRLLGALARPMSNRFGLGLKQLGQGRADCTLGHFGDHWLTSLKSCGPSTGDNRTRFRQFPVPRPLFEVICIDSWFCAALSRPTSGTCSSVTTGAIRSGFEAVGSGGSGMYFEPLV